MISLKLALKDEVPFTQYPQLMDIWPSSYIHLAVGITTEELMAGAKEGPIFLILDDDEVVGLTGAFVWPDNPAMMGLRWTGVILSKRKLGIASAAIQLLLKYIKDNKLPCSTWIKILPITPYGSSMKPFFEKFGFVATNNIEYYDWLGCDGQEYHYSVNDYAN